MQVESIRSVWFDMGERHQWRTMLGWLLSASRGNLTGHAVSISLCLLASTIATAEPLVLKLLVDDTVRGRGRQLGIYLAIGFASLVICRHAFQCTASTAAFSAVLKCMLKVRKRLLARLLNTSPDFAAHIRPGEMLFRLERDVEQVASIGGELFSVLIQTAAVVAMISVAMFTLDARLACFVLPLVPCTLAFHRKYRVPLQTTVAAVLRKSQDLSGYLDERLSAIEQIQLLGVERSTVRGLVARGAGIIRAQMMRRRVEFAFHMSTVSVSAAGAGLILGIGSLQVERGATTIGTLVAFYGYLSRLLDPIGTAVDAFAQVQRMFGSIGRLREMENAGPVFLDKPSVRALRQRPAGLLTIEQVQFSYGEKREILRGVNLDLVPGEPLALVGGSGSGKSTLARLLVRLHDPAEGRITLDGTDTRELSYASLRSSVVLLPQDPVLFHLTIRENLLLACPSASTRELNFALTAAQCGDILRRLKDGMDSGLGPRGCWISAGERQRIAIARLLLQSPPVVILDEATAALDGQTEQLLLEALSEFFRARTVLMISHRIAPIIWASNIAFLRDGAIAAQGKHKYMFNNNREYRDLLGGFNDSLASATGVELKSWTTCPS